ncbi:MAG: hypothetical protein WC814_00050 [Candidatus Paceibacterota bacterium]|jgi:hypothetical protein
MPQKRNNPEPPEVMTWSKAAPVLAVAVISDLLRLFFQMFWFFGPALAALLCTVGMNDVLGTSVSGVGGKIVAGTCTAVAATAGAAGMPAIEALGIVMADAVGLFAFLVLGFWMLRTNARIFAVIKNTWLWLTGSLGVSIIPIIGAFPAFSVILWRLYRRQIKLETAAYKKWKKEQSARQLQERTWREAQFMQAQADQLASAEVY